MSLDKLVICPYDESHKVKASRLQIHIIKCKENRKIPTTFTCPFNASHIYPEREKSLHLLNCPDRGIVERTITANNNPYKGLSVSSSYSEPSLVDSGEVWELEELGSPGYIPAKIPVGAIIEPKPLSKPAMRRLLYLELRRDPSALDQRSHGSFSPSSAHRQPRQPCQAERSYQETILRHLGLGRGISRSPERSFEEQGGDVQLLGLGRGISYSSERSFEQEANAQLLGLRRDISHSSERSFQQEANVQLLGLGRGISHSLERSFEEQEDDVQLLGLGRGNYSKVNGMDFTCIPAKLAFSIYSVMIDRSSVFTLNFDSQLWAGLGGYTITDLPTFRFGKVRSIFNCNQKCSASTSLLQVVY